MFSTTLFLIALTSPPDPSVLSPDAQRVYREVITEEFCSCDSALTLAGCLEMRPTCSLAENLGGLVFKAAESGVKSEELLAYLSRSVMGPFCRPAANIVPPKGVPAKGPDDAEITVVEFADFRCGHCRAAAPVIKAAAAKNPKVRFVFLPFPLQNNAMSVAAAEAALAGGAQGKFWEMHDILFENQDKGFAPDQITRLARKAGLDMGKFEAAVASGAHRAEVEKYRKMGLAANIEGTPAFFVNGRSYDLDPILFTFAERFRFEAARNQGNCQ